MSILVNIEGRQKAMRERLSRRVWIDGGTRLRLRRKLCRHCGKWRAVRPCGVFIFHLNNWATYPQQPCKGVGRQA